jgi:hypothetical protein
MVARILGGAGSSARSPGTEGDHEPPDAGVEDATFNRFWRFRPIGGTGPGISLVRQNDHKCHCGQGQHIYLGGQNDQYRRQQ